jgi:hypothetical protein
MKKAASIAAVFVMTAAVGFAETWTGNLVDAFCRVASEGRDLSKTNCAATSATHLFAIELSDTKILNLDAAGNEKAANAVKNLRKANPRAIVTGSLQGMMVRVETIEIQ